MDLNKKIITSSIISATVLGALVITPSQITVSANQATSQVVTVNKANLVQQLKWSTAYKASDYTPASYNKLQADINTAKQLLNNLNATQAQIDTITATLHNDGFKLVKVTHSINKANLIQQLKWSAAYKASDYTPASYAKLAFDIIGAQQLLNDPDASQKAIDLTTETLHNDGLKLIKALQTNLLQQLKWAAAYKASDYTPASYNKLQADINTAKQLLNNYNTPQAQFDAITTALHNDAVNLVKAIPVTNKTNLLQQLKWAAAYKASDYTPASYNKLQADINTANQLLNNPYTIQAQFDAITTALHNDALNLVKVIPVTNKTNLLQQLKWAAVYKASDYTPASYNKLQADINTANQLLNNPYTTQAQFDAITTVLHNDALNLVKLAPSAKAKIQALNDSFDAELKKSQEANGPDIDIAALQSQLNDLQGKVGANQPQLDKLAAQMKDAQAAANNQQIEGYTKFYNEGQLPTTMDLDQTLSDQVNTTYDNSAVVGQGVNADQLKELSVYANMLLNSYRASKGLSQVKLQQNEVDYATALAQRMTQGNASGIIGSEENGAAFRAWYLSDSITDSGSVMATQYEIGNSDGINQANGARRFNAATAPTMANVKADIYEAIREMLANNDGHTANFLQQDITDMVLLPSIVSWGNGEYSYNFNFLLLDNNISHDDTIMKNGVAKQLDLIKNAISIPKAPTYNGPSYETLKPQYDALKSKVDAWQIQMVNLQNQITIVNSGSVEINPDIYNHIEDMIADLTTKYSNLLDTMSDKAQMPTIDAFVNSLIKKADNIFHSQF